MKRVVVFIDGNNFYFGLRKLYGKDKSLKNFDFQGFANFLAGEGKVVGIYYYNAQLDKEFNPKKFQSQQKTYILYQHQQNMKMVSIPKTEYERMRQQIAKLRKLEQIDFDLVRQFKDSLEDVKAGRIRRVA